MYWSEMSLNVYNAVVQTVEITWKAPTNFVQQACRSPRRKPHGTPYLQCRWKPVFNSLNRLEGTVIAYKVSAETKAHILTREILPCWVIPAYILLDRDQLFISSESKESCRLWNLQLNPPCHPETKLTER